MRFGGYGITTVRIEPRFLPIPAPRHEECHRCHARVPVRTAQNLWSGDDVSFLAPHEMEESSFYPGAGGKPLRVARRVGCSGSRTEVEG